MNILIILGCNNISENINRIRYSIRLSVSLNIKYFFLSGNENEINIMLCELKKFGVYKNIIFENKSKNTIDNIINSFSILFSYKNCNDYIFNIVSSNYHITRIQYIINFLNFDINKFLFHSYNYNENDYLIKMNNEIRLLNNDNFKNELKTKFNLNKNKLLIKHHLYDDFKSIKNDIYTTFTNEFTNIIPNLYLSNCNSSMNLSLLKKYNIKTVISLLDFDKPQNILQQYNTNNIKHYSFYMMDIPNFNIKNVCDKSFDIINSNIKNESILVHCKAGISRSVSIILHFLIKNNFIINFENINYSNNLSSSIIVNNLIKFIKSKRKIINPNNSFVEQLIKITDTYITFYNREI